MTLIVLTFLICAADGTACELGSQAHRSCITAQAEFNKRRKEQ
jgi:hypothetical protein